MTKLVGILNITPDSFSDGGDTSPEAILRKAESLIAEGAAILDVGAESTRPNAKPLSSEQELERLAPVWGELVTLCRKHAVEISLDTRHAQTATHALAIGCDWINDVSGLRDAAMLEAVRDASCKLVVMHSLSVPAIKGEALPSGTDMAAFMRDWIAQTQQRLEQAGIAPERVIYDAGIGFGKNPIQNWQLLASLAQWRGDAPILIGHSRKSFLALISDVPAQGRDDITRAVSAMLAVQGIDYLRVHDVAGHRTMLKALSL